MDAVSDVQLNTSLYSSVNVTFYLQDYWSTYIYKYLVGSKVLHVKTKLVSYRMSMKDDNDEMTDKKYLRVYAQCTATRYPFRAHRSG